MSDQVLERLVELVVEDAALHEAVLKAIAAYTHAQEERAKWYEVRRTRLVDRQRTRRDARSDARVT